MRELDLKWLLAVILMVTVGGIPPFSLASNQEVAGPQQRAVRASASEHSPRNSCPASSKNARSMVDNFLTNPGLSDARAATGTESISTEQVQVVEDSGVCQTLNSRYEQHTDNYDMTYFKAGSRYFVTFILKQPDEPNEFVSGISIIAVLDSNLNKIESYGG